jgi:hypothetical protein
MVADTGGFHKHDWGYFMFTGIKIIIESVQKKHLGEDA